METRVAATLGIPSGGPPCHWGGGAGRGGKGSSGHARLKCRRARAEPPDPPLQWLPDAMSAYVDPDELMLFSVGMVLGVDLLDYMVDVVLDRRLTRADHRKLSLALERKGGRLPVRVEEVLPLVSQRASARPN